LERSLAVGDRLGGHWVTGHIDSQGVLEAKETLDGFEKWTVRLTDPATARYLVPKGSIAVNGVSLTVNEVAGGNFSLMLIPHTVSTTSFHQAVVGDRFNLEFDCLVKTVIQEMSRWRSGVEGGTTFGNK
jgi:riboflavin synthase